MKLKEVETYIYQKLECELPQHLYYHSIYHVKDVLSAAIRIAEAEGINEEDMLLLQTAVLFHDVGFTVNGFTINQSFNALQSNVRSIPAFRDRLLLQNGNNQQAQVNALFNAYNY